MKQAAPPNQNPPPTADPSTQAPDAPTPGKATLRIDGDIGQEQNTSAAVAAWLDQNANASDVLVIINSPGGDVFQGLAIEKQLEDAAASVNLITQVEGLAASAGAVIFMAGSERLIPRTGMLMIHTTSGNLQGNAQALRDFAAVVETVDEQIANLFAERTSQPIAKIRELMSAETWMTADQALQLGFATGTADGAVPTPTNSASLARFNYRHTPKRLLAASDPIRALDELRKHRAQLTQLRRLIDA